MGSTSTPFTTNVSNTCDEYSNFEAVFTGGVASMLFAYHAPCDAPVPSVRTLTGDANGWTDFLGSPLLATMPNRGNARYTSHLAVNAQGERFALVGDNTRLLVAAFDMNGPVWLAPVAEGQSNISQPRVFADANGDPIVLYRAGTEVRIARAN